MWHVQTSEELLRIAMDHSEGVYSEASIDLRRGYCLESFDEKQGDCLAKQKMEKQREKDLEAEFRNFCR